MKRIIVTVALVLGFALQSAKATPMQQVYREVQSILYTTYHGDATGWAAVNWYLQSCYGLSVSDFFYLYDNLQFDGPVEWAWTQF